MKSELTNQLSFLASIVTGLDGGLGDAFAGHEGRIVMLGALGRAGLPDAGAPARGQPAQVVEVVASGDVMGEGGPVVGMPFQDVEVADCCG